MRNRRSAALVLPAACTTEPAIRPEFEQNRAVQESINYYYSEKGPYAYGQMV
jgi:hypothetical protein